jgi:hypothetical protein
MGFTVPTGAIELPTAQAGDRVDVQSEFTDLIRGDRAVRGDRYQVLLSESRSASFTTDLRPYQEPIALGTPYQWLVAGAAFQVPDPVPGSANVSATTGSTLATRGGLQVAADLNAAVFYVALRRLNTTTQALTNRSTLTLARGTATRGVETGQVLFPTGMNAGDWYAIDVLWRPNSGVLNTVGTLYGFAVWELPLSTLAP